MTAIKGSRVLAGSRGGSWDDGMRPVVTHRPFSTNLRCCSSRTCECSVVFVVVGPENDTGHGLHGGNGALEGNGTKLGKDNDGEKE